MLSSRRVDCRRRTPSRFARLLFPGLLTLLSLTGAACTGGPGTGALDRLHPCTSAEGPTDAYCGTLTVFEDRTRQAGRQIKLWIVMLPAVRPDRS